jgi:hypothetical protein
MAINFPPSPVIGELFTVGAMIWLWDGAKWIFVPSAGAGGGGATINRIINGDMLINQRGAILSNVLNVFPADRWQYLATLYPRGNAGRIYIGTAAPAYWALSYQNTLQNSNVAFLEIVCFRQTIEADMLGDIRWGSAGAKPLTLSFDVLASGGIPEGVLLGGSIQNAAQTRSFPFQWANLGASYNRIVIPIPGDPTIGTFWIRNGNVASLHLNFALNVGNGFRQPANAWFAGNAIAPVDVVNIGALNSINITNVKLEVGDQATPFDFDSLAKRLADCQRYYQIIHGLEIAGMPGTTPPYYLYHSYPLPVTMRAPITLGAPSNTNAQATFSNIANTTNYTNNSITHSPIVTAGAASNAVINTRITCPALGFARATYTVAVNAEYVPSATLFDAPVQQPVYPATRLTGQPSPAARKNGY